ncbi:hypothetical protein N7492_003063 [Penicillium capsulatum]|uniref:Uncharacterized protein n=1 Tax=Penicillium capsulatum TaxID=69766 RepID=A0A9W9IKJ2_9EURO|nr:hypothetical protein N7492_003063 [Penicillium capsulatum]KAJ6122346.1 hypothetical protein N7512_004811 [Penicillium capsulatum]
MWPDLLKPLAALCSQPQSQRYITSIRNLGNAWRSLTEPPLSESDQASAIVETNFDFILKVSNRLADNCQSNTTIVDMSTTSRMTEPPEPTQSPRHYRIFADYGRVLSGEIPMTFASGKETVCWKLKKYSPHSLLQSWSSTTHE